jgi:tetratricopeptide (TPR) repeat protein
VTGAEALVRGRAAFGRRAWGDAFADLSSVDARTPLTPQDLERLAVAAYLLGRDADSDHTLARAHLRWLESGEVECAVRCAFWLAYSMLSRGELAPAGGWIARARRLLDEHQLDCVEQGYLLVPLALKSIDDGDAANGYAMFGQIAKFAERFRDPDLMALARLGTGSALLRLGETGAGMALLDEAMASISVDQVSAIVMGVVYCAVIQECHAVFDVRRAQEWTAALTRWCDAQPDLVPFRGQCLVHRSQLLQLRGAWPEAMDEVRRARERLSSPPGQPALGMAIYEQAELHRLRGEFDKADAAYREATRWGHPVQPGLALLHLARRHVDAATAAISVCLDQTRDRLARATLLPAYVEINLTAHDVASARTAADELSGIATGLDMPLLRAVSARATGAVLLAEGRHAPALAALRQACNTWRDIDAPYEVARTRELVGLAYRSLGDQDSARMELDAARRAYQQVGALPDVARLRAALPVTTGEAAGARPRRCREEQPNDRRSARGQRTHRRAPPAEHLHKARPVVADRGQCVRPRARVDRSFA